MNLTEQELGTLEDSANLPYEFQKLYIALRTPDIEDASIVAEALDDLASLVDDIAFNLSDTVFDAGEWGQLQYIRETIQKAQGYFTGE